MVAHSRILFYLNDLPLTSSTLCASNLAGALAREGHGVDVLSPGGGLAELFAEGSCQLSIRPRLRQFPWRLLERTVLLPHLRARDFDVVHVHRLEDIVAGKWFARKLRIPLVASVSHYTRHFDGWLQWSGVAAVLAGSEELRQRLRNNSGVPRERLHVVPAGVDEPSAGRAPFDCGAEAPAVVGTVVEPHRLDTLSVFLEAGRQIVEADPRTQLLVLCGAGAKQATMRSLSRASGLAKHVTFVSGGSFAKTLEQLDVCLLPDIGDGPVQLVLDVMVAARPVVAWGQRAAYVVLDDERTGLLVDKSEACGLAQAVLRLLADRELARNLGKAAREHVLAAYPNERFAKLVEGVYDGVCGAR